MCRFSFLGGVLIWATGGLQPHRHIWLFCIDSNGVYLCSSHRNMVCKISKGGGLSDVETSLQALRTLITFATFVRHMMGAHWMPNTPLIWAWWMPIVCITKLAEVIIVPSPRREVSTSDYPRHLGFFCIPYSYVSLISRPHWNWYEKEWYFPTQL